MGNVLVIGAGIAGLTAATELARRKIPCVVLDKGRAPGGRMATRTIDGARFDHGAQHFSARSVPFRTAVARWRHEGVVGEWFSSPVRQSTQRTVEPRLLGVDGMRSIPVRLAAGLDVRTSITVDRLRVSTSGVEALTGDDVIARGSGVILTPPLPQLVRLLDRSGVELTAELSRRLRAVSYHATLAVMATLDAPSGLANGHLSQPGEPIAWIGDNHHKGISEAPAVTIHSTPGFAAQHLDADPKQWTRTLSEHAQPHLVGRIVAATGHRWRYAEPNSTFDDGAVLVDAERRVVLAGEVFSAARVEGAFLSGLAAAARVAALW